MGPFIQGRMVLPFQPERTESLFLSPSRRETLQLVCLENHSTIFTALLRVKQWPRKVFVFTLHWKPTQRNVDFEMFKFHPSRIISINFSCRKVTPQIQKIHTYWNWETLICIFVTINYPFVKVLWPCLVLYLFLFSPTTVMSNTLHLLKRLPGSIPITAEWMNS